MNGWSVCGWFRTGRVKPAPTFDSPPPPQGRPPGMATAGFSQPKAAQRLGRQEGAEP